AEFNVTLSVPSGQIVTADFATANVTAKSGAKLGEGDYDAIAGTVTFPEGSTLQKITVTVNNDLLNEINETFAVNLSNVADTKAKVIKDKGIATIIDNDLQPTLTIED